MSTPRTYFRLAPVYAEELGGLRWATGDNVLELRDGSCFLFSEQVADFLEGFASVRPLLNFTHMVHLLALLRCEPGREQGKEHPRLSRAFLDTGRHLRNAGAFCAVLCGPLPVGLRAGQFSETIRWLRWREQVLHWSIYGPQSPDDNPVDSSAEVPPLTPHEFEARVAAALEAYSDDELDAWLRHGRGPEREAARALAEAFPTTLAGRLATLLDRPRLAGAAAFLRRLTGALALPPPRLGHHDLPIGGYTDVTTRGQVDQILPSQFALDEWDFLRRFVERELLYFRREEPHEQTRRELVVLLDQGVRTWGDVRIVLGASLLALGRRAIDGKLPFRVATSAAPRIVDPLELSSEILGRLVEASDLTANPAAALEQVLEDTTTVERDVVLLTHPRSLGEAEVRKAAHRVRAGTRLFAVTLDRHGHAALSEMKQGAPVTVREFRVDLEPARARPEPIADGKRAVGGWRGDVEPMPYPFLFGAQGILGPNTFDFNFDSKLLLTAGPQGMLHLWNIDGSVAEILPRGFYRERVVDSVTAVRGVVDGFIVVGVLPQRRYVVMHYDLTRRTCTPHAIGEGRGGAWQWEYSPAHHCVIAAGTMDQNGFVVDLGTGERYATYLGGPHNRAQRAWEAWTRREVPRHRLGVTSGGSRSRALVPLVSLDGDSGMVVVHHVDPPWEAFQPNADGQPMLEQHLLLAAQCRGNVLALKTSHLGRHTSLSLRLFRGPDGIFLGEHAMSHERFGFALSPNGLLLARQVSRGVVEISQVAGSITPVGRTTIGGFPQNVKFVLGDRWLLLFPGTNGLLLNWASGKLTCRGQAQVGGSGASADAVPPFLRYDRTRWELGAGRRVFAASDRYGQVAVFDADGDLICMFFAVRNRVAGWMPDGTCFGPASLTGRSPSANAMRKFGEALRAASEYSPRRED